MNRQHPTPERRDNGIIMILSTGQPSACTGASTPPANGCLEDFNTGPVNGNWTFAFNTTRTGQSGPPDLPTSRVLRRPQHSRAMLFLRTPVSCKRHPISRFANSRPPSRSASLPVTASPALMLPSMGTPTPSPATTRCFTCRITPTWGTSPPAATKSVA